MPNQVNVQGILATENVIQIASGRLRNIADGSDVTGIAVVPWAKFIVDSSDPLVGVDPTVACNYMISDREVYPGGGLPVFQINPLAAKKRSIISDHLYIADFANRPSAVDFPGLDIMIGNFGNAIARSDGANWLAKGRQYVYNEQNGTIATPTKTLTLSGTPPTAFTSAIPNIPANLIVPGKSVLKVNYTLLHVTGFATGTVDFAIRLGTAGNSTDPLAAYTSGIAATNNYFARGTTKIMCPDSTHLLTNRGNAESGVGTNLLFDGGPTNFDTTQALIFQILITARTAATDVVALLDLDLIWER